MANWIEVVSDTVVNVTVGSTAPTGGEFLPQPYGVWIDWTRVGSVWTGPNGEPQETEPVPEQRYTSVLEGPVWVARFTDQEWQFIKSNRSDGSPAGDNLDRMMDAIRWTNSIDVSSPNMDAFYTWLLNNGLPGGQTRIDELRASVLI